MHSCTRGTIVIALGLGLSGTTLAQHGRPPMVYEVVSISAKALQIFQGEDESEALDINNVGEVVGWSTTATGHTHAFKRALLGSTVDIGAAYPSNDTVAIAINDHSGVVSYRQAGAHKRAFYWSSRSGFLNLSHVNPLGVDEARDYVAEAINSQGRIVGWALDAVREETVTGVNEAGTVVGSANFPVTGRLAIRWRRAGNPLLLGVLPGGRDSEAFDMNDTEFVVGSDTGPAPTGGWRERAFLFHYDFGMVELPAPAWNGGPVLTDCHANRLNDRKENGLVQIAGYCARYGKKPVVGMCS